MLVNQAELKFFERLAEEAESASSQPPIDQISIDDIRKQGHIFDKFAGQAANVSIENRSIKVRDGYEIPIRIYNSDLTEKLPVLIMLPGCGYILPLFEGNAIACSLIAKYSGIKVIVVDYRLAPENPMPIPIYDAYDITKYIATHDLEFNIDADKVFIGGVSSGANAAAVISNLARQDPDFKIYHQILLNGVYDLTRSNEDYNAYENEDKICRRDYTDLLISYWGISPDEYSNPLFSPYCETDLSGLPDTTVIVAEYDGLRNDSESYFLKISRSNSNCQKIILPGQTHNTLLMRDVLSDGIDPAQAIAQVICASFNKIV